MQSSQLRPALRRLLVRASSSSAALDRRSCLSLLEMLGGPGAVAQLDRSAAFEGPAFAVIKVGGEVVRDELSVLATSCTVLHRLGLKPVVVHGGGPQLNAELARDGVEPSYVRGHRVTDEATLRVAERVFTDLNGQVASALEAMGTPAAPFARDVFRAEVADPELGFVGEITGLDSEAVSAALEAGRVPVLTSLGVGADGQLLNINADVAARELAVAIQPRRIVFTSAKGGWRDDDTGRVVDVVDLTREYDRLAAKDYTGRQGTLLKLNEIKLLLDQLPSSSSVSISSAASVVKNLFSAGSSDGTLFVRGERVQRYDSIGQLDVVRLQALLSGSGAVESSDSSLFEGLQSEAELGVYATPSLSCCAIVAANEEGDGSGASHRLAALAVREEAHGMGCVEALWSSVVADFPSLVWSGARHVGGVDLSALESVVTSTPSDALDGTVTCTRVPPPPAEAAAAAGSAKEDAAEVDGRTSSWSNLDLAPKPSLGTNSPPYKVGLLGARGFVGREFVRLVLQHPSLELSLASSRALSGQKVSEAFGLDPKIAHVSIPVHSCKESVSDQSAASVLKPRIIRTLSTNQSRSV